MKYLDTFLMRLMRILDSRTFFWCVLGLLVVQAAWIALTGRYPMAFDEDFHLGIIRIYAQHLSPFLLNHPAGADAFGPVARDPSYLYHYLFSFPYRLIQLFTHDQTIQVILLRFLNIGLFASGLVLYRRLLTRLGAPSGVVHGSLLFFIVIPVVPLLAAQINYDNLFLPATAACLLLTVRFIEQLKLQQFDLLALLWLGTACFLTSQIKYAFLPIFLTLGVYTLVVLTQVWRQMGRAFWQMIRRSPATLSRLTLAASLALLILALGLFSQRYLVNMTRYHTPIPDCSKVLTVRQCSAYGPWIRDYTFAATKTTVDHNPVAFSEDWLYGMWLRLYFAVDGPATQFQTRGPLRVPALSAIIIVVGGFTALVVDGRQLLRRYNRPAVILCVATSGVYVATLWVDTYRAYLRTGQPVAINGRYLLPFVPLLLVLGALAGRELLKNRPRLSGLLVVGVLLSQLWGGGALTFILRSNDAWYWPNRSVHTANHAVQNVLGPLTPGYNTPTQFLR